MRNSTKSIIYEIKSLFKNKGNEDYFGENISQYEHAAQCLMMAISEEETQEMQVAALLHDIGHLLDHAETDAMDVYGRKDHEEAAEAWLSERGFSERIQKVVKNHVKAKRYLCFKYKEYHDALSEASKQTMRFQGGIMSQDEALEFENDTNFIESIKLREWDDKAKIPNIDLPELDDCLEIVNKYLLNR
jgi:2-amino-1-hydroxyethylphosphonate dioxygenase (glycine-forming)